MWREITVITVLVSVLISTFTVAANDDDTMYILLDDASIFSCRGSKFT